MSLVRTTVDRALRAAPLLGAATLAAAWATLLDRARPALIGEARAALGVADLAALFALHAVVAGAALAVGLALWGLGALAARLLPARPSLARWAVALLAALAAAPLVQRVSVDTTRGSWVAAQAWVGALRLALTAAGALAVLLLARAVVALRPVAAAGRRDLATLATAPDPPPEVTLLRRVRRLAAPAGWLVAAAVVSIADAAVLVGLYPAAHAALWALGVVLVLLAALRALAVVRHASPRIGAALGLALGACLLLAPAAWPRGAWRRANVVLASPVAERLFRVDARAMPEGLLADVLAAAARGSRAVRAPTATRRAPLVDHVVLIVVDSLRADAVLPVRGAGSLSARRGDTPFLDGWLPGLVQFRHAYAQAGRTRASMPHMFRSLEPSEDAQRLGVALADRMAALGRTPVAVVPPYFLVPREPEARQLLDGFAAVEVYRQDHQEEEVALVRRVLGAQRGRPLFAWIHLYGVHWPYYAGPSAPDPAGRSLAQRYRASVRWLDGQVRQIVEAVDAACPPERTAIVFASDHGERLGPGGVGHGTTVREGDVRVPLALRLPGERGRVIERVVGNIDIVPTLVDLVGGEPDPALRGRSLLPVAASPRTSEARPYLIATGNLTAWGLVLERDKLLYAPDSGALYRYDLRRDAGERRNLFGFAPRRDAALLAEMIRRHPALAAPELEKPEGRALLGRALAAVSPSAPGPDAELVVRLAAQSPDPEHRAALLRLLGATNAPSLGAAIVAATSTRGRVDWKAPLQQNLAPRSDAEVQAWVEALAAVLPSPFAEPAMRDRLLRRVDGPVHEWTPWLRLVTRWRGRASLWGAPLARMLARRSSSPEAAAPATLTAVLGAIAACRGWRPALEALPELAAQVAALVDDPDGRIAAAACDALGALGAAAEAPRVERRLADPGADLRVRQAALRSLAELLDDAAVPRIVAAGREPALALDAVRTLGQLRSSAAAPFLRDVAQHHANSFTRRSAERALARLEGAPPARPVRAPSLGR